MKMDTQSALAPQMVAEASPEVFQQLGHITRQLHDTLQAARRDAPACNRWPTACPTPAAA